MMCEKTTRKRWENERRKKKGLRRTTLTDYTIYVFFFFLPCGVVAWGGGAECCEALCRRRWRDESLTTPTLRHGHDPLAPAVEAIRPPSQSARNTGGRPPTRSRAQEIFGNFRFAPTTTGRAVQVGAKKKTGKNII